MPNVKLWLSAEAETGFPEKVPDGARVARMQTDAEAHPEETDLVFLDHPMRKTVSSRHGNSRAGLPKAITKHVIDDAYAQATAGCQRNKIGIIPIPASGD